jgi:cbb3-type cytochrome oxidase subunit 1
MEWFSKAFLKSGLVWLALGATLGAAMALRPAWLVYRPAHLHMNLLGFVSMSIAGVAYHVVPRFTGHPLFSRRLATLHWWLANVGLVVLAAGFLLMAAGRGYAAPLGVGGVLTAVAALCFVVNIWGTIDGRVMRKK